MARSPGRAGTTTRQFPRYADAVVTTGDLVVAGRNAVEATAGQWALVQELQTAPLQLLIARSADLTIRARGPGHHERPGEVLDVRRRAFRGLPTALAMDRRQKLLRLIAERRIRALDISADW